MEAIKTLHSTGLRHGDLHASNIRLDSQDPTKIYIIDFGLAGDSGISRKLDMRRLIKVFAILSLEPKPYWLEVFESQMTTLTKSDDPLYDVWIQFFRSNIHIHRGYSSLPPGLILSFKMRFNKFVISTSIILMNEHRLCLSAGPDGLAPDSGDGVGAGGPAAAAASDAAAPPLEDSAAMRPEHWLKKFKSYQCQKILLSDDKLDKLEKGLDLGFVVAGDEKTPKRGYLAEVLRGNMIATRARMDRRRRQQKYCTRTVKAKLGSPDLSTSPLDPLEYSLPFYTPSTDANVDKETGCVLSSTKVPITNWTPIGLAEAYVIAAHSSLPLREALEKIISVLRSADAAKADEANELMSIILENGVTEDLDLALRNFATVLIAATKPEAESNREGAARRGARGASTRIDTSKYIPHIMQALRLTAESTSAAESIYERHYNKALAIGLYAQMYTELTGGRGVLPPL